MKHDIDRVMPNPISFVHSVATA